MKLINLPSLKKNFYTSTSDFIHQQVLMIQSLHTKEDVPAGIFLGSLKGTLAPLWCVLQCIETRTILKK